ncbi:MAG: PKD domain-containing protein [Candidatus Thermoplasmatota archaeon]
MELKDKKFLSIIIAAIIVAAGVATVVTFGIKQIEEKADLPLSAEIFADRSEGTAPFSINFSSIVMNYEGDVEYQWDFGNGEKSEGKEVSTVYKDEGEYTCILTVEDEDGEKDTDSIKVLAKKNKAPMVSLSINQRTINRKFNWLSLLSILPLRVAAYPGNQQKRLDAVEERKGINAFGKGRLEVTAQVSDPENDEIVSYDWKVQTADSLLTAGGEEVLPVHNLSGEANVTIPEICAWQPFRHLVTLTVTDSAGNKAGASIDFSVSRSNKLTKFQEKLKTVQKVLPLIPTGGELIWPFIKEPVSTFLDERWLSLPPLLQDVGLYMLGFLNWGYEAPIQKADLNISNIEDINLSTYVNETTGEVEEEITLGSSFTITNEDSENSAEEIYMTLDNPASGEEGLNSEIENENITVSLDVKGFSYKLFYKGKYTNWQNCHNIQKLSPGDEATVKIEVTLKEGAVLDKSSYPCELYVYQAKTLDKEENVDEIAFTVIT